MFSYLNLEDSKIINLDYFLNKSQLDKVTKVLTAISVKLGELYYQEQLSQANNPDNLLLYIVLCNKPLPILIQNPDWSEGSK